MVTYEHWFGLEHHLVADALHEFASMLADPDNTHRTDVDRAERHFRRALVLRIRAVGAVNIKTAETMFSLGMDLDTFRYINSSI